MIKRRDRINGVKSTVKGGLALFLSKKSGKKALAGPG
jgi:hypothetical protein